MRRLTARDKKIGGAMSSAGLRTADDSVAERDRLCTTSDLFVLTDEVERDGVTFVGDPVHVLCGPEDAAGDHAERRDDDARQEKAKASGETFEQRIGGALETIFVHCSAATRLCGRRHDGWVVYFTREKKCGAMV